MNDPVVDAYSSKSKVSVVALAEDKTVPAFEIEILEDGAEEPTVKQFSAIDITSKMLSKLKSTAEYFLSRKVDGCVISIPAHFEEVQKDALTLAAKNAGFSFSYPIHEPVAAALAFNASVLKETEKLDKQILVLDLGADSFNISLVSDHDGIFTIEDSVEELHLGGAAFDKVLFDFAKDDFKKKTKMDLTENKRSVAKLMNACENTKRALTRQETAPCFVESLFEGIDYNSSIIRSRFEVLSEPLYNRCKKVVLDALKKSKVSPEELDQVLLVGGSSRMPRFQQVMQSLFPNVGTSTEFRTEVEPDEAIALGCACQIEFLEADYATVFAKQVIEADHLSKSIGTVGADGKFTSLIPQGTPVPVRRAFQFPLPSGQTSVLFPVSELEGSGTLSRLAEVALVGIPADVKNGKIEAVFLVENDHILSISLSEKVSGEKVEVKVV